MSDWLARRAVRRRDLRRATAEAAMAGSRRGQALADPSLSPLERLLFWWAAAPGNFPATSLDAAEARLGVTFPVDFRAYLMAAMPDGNAMDDNGTRWWPLDEIKPVREECETWEAKDISGFEDALVFADFLIWCYAWAIDCSDGPNRGKIALIGTKRYVANSFDEFLDRYLHDDASIHGGSG